MRLATSWRFIFVLPSDRPRSALRQLDRRVGWQARRGHRAWFTPVSAQFDAGPAVSRRALPIDHIYRLRTNYGVRQKVTLACIFVCPVRDSFTVIGDDIGTPILAGSPQASDSRARFSGSGARPGLEGLGWKTSMPPRGRVGLILRRGAGGFPRRRDGRPRALRGTPATREPRAMHPVSYSPCVPRRRRPWRMTRYHDALV